MPRSVSTVALERAGLQAAGARVEIEIELELGEDGLVHRRADRFDDLHQRVTVIA